MVKIGGICMKFQIKFNFPLTKDELACNLEHVYVTHYFTQKNLKSDLVSHRIGDGLYSGKCTFVKIECYQ